MMKIIDQIGTQLEFSETPKRVISLVPSQTEFLYDLGLNDRLVGVTKFCVHPAHLRKELTVIGGTKQVKVGKIEALAPDLVIANKEENTKEDIEHLSSFCQVYVSDIKNPLDALTMMNSLAELLHLPFSEEPYHRALASLNTRKRDLGKAVYLIWKDPYMAAGGDTFINSMLNLSGFRNVLQNELRYPQLSENDLINLNLDWVLLSSEPFPFKEKHISELKTILPNAKIKLVDGEAFSWYGSRIIPSVRYIKELFYNP